MKVQFAAGAVAATVSLLLSAAAGATVPLQGSQIDLLGTTAPTFFGATANSLLTEPVPAGDVNGDGIADLMFGDAKAGGSSRVIAVVFGSSAPQGFTMPAIGAAGFIITGRPGGLDQPLGAAGDVNGDGLGDLLIGDGENPAGGVNAGAVHVVFGKPTTTPIDLTALGGGGFTITGDEGDLLGASTSGAGVGDLNGDGRADVAVGGVGAKTGAASGPGEAYVVFGRSSTTPVAVHTGLGGQGFVIANSAGAAGDRFGLTITAAGDFNGDGVGDIGVRQDSSVGPDFPTADWIVFGKATTTPVDVATSGAVRIDTPGPADIVGAVRPAGDVNGDGRADVILGVTTSAPSPLGRLNAGTVAIVYGRFATTLINPLTLGTGGFRVEGAVAGDRLSAIGVSPDLDGDGRRDIVVSAIFADNRGRTDSGSVWTLPAVAPSTGDAYDLQSPPPGTRRIDGPEASFFLSRAAPVGDVNGDGRADLGVGSTSALGTRGVSYLLFGFGPIAASWGPVAGTAGTPIAAVAPTGVRRTGPVSFAAAGLPAGLAIDPGTGVISGTPQAAAGGTASVTVTDLSGSLVVPVPLAIAGAPGAAARAARLSGASISPRRFASVRRRGSRVPVGATLRWKLSADASVTVVISSLSPGRRAGKRCVSGRRSGARCTISRRVGKLTAKAKAGNGSLRLTGKLGGKSLRPGRYRAALTPSGGGAAVFVTFTVVRA